MDSVYRELDDLKVEVEKFKAECQVKSELVESLKNARNEEYLKFQEIIQQTEKQAHELHLKSEEICELRKVHEDLKSNLLEKEVHAMHLSSENKKLQANFSERLSNLEEVNRELVLALDELTVKNTELEKNACANNKEISGLRTLLTATEKKYLEAEEKSREAKMFRQTDDFIMKLEEENRNVHDKMKWKIEQFRHLEEAHERLQSQFQSDKEQWEKEKSALLEEITSLQTSLDSQTRTLEAVQSRLEMCNHALAHQESKRKVLEAEISEFKSRFEDVFTQCEEERSKIQNLTIQRNEEIAELRNSLGEKETLVREMEIKIVWLEQENQELGDSLKELREAQIQNAGANPLLSKLRNKLRRLEEAHKDCASTMKCRECQWINQVEKMEEDIRTYKSSLTSKEQEIKDLLMELENCHYAIGEYSMGLLIFKSELVEAYTKLFSVETDKAVQTKAKEDMTLLSTVQLGEKEVYEKLLEESLEGQLEVYKKMLEESSEGQLEVYKKMLEESSEGQLVFKGQLLEMENTLKYERRAALEAQEKLGLEIADKNNEISQYGCELEKWKSTAETLKVCSEEIQVKCQKMESSLISLGENEQALKDENESLSRIAKEQERKAEELQKQIALLELYNASKLKEEEIFKQGKEKLELELANKNVEITQLRCESEKWKSTAETLKSCSEESQGKCQKMESSLISHVENEQALKDENESLGRIAKEQEKKAEELQKQIALLESYNASKLKEAETFKQEKEKLELKIQVAFEVQEKLKLEIANKNNEIIQLGCELEKWKSTAETLKACSEEIEGKCQKMESSLISHVENEQALKDEYESLILKVKEQEGKAEELQKQIALLELSKTSKLKEAETYRQEKASLLQNIEEKECCIKDLQNDIAMARLQQESLKIEAASATLALFDADKALKQEKGNLLNLKEEKDQIIKHLQELAMSLEQDLMCALSFALSEQMEKWVEVGVLTGALKDAEYLAKKEIEEKNLRIMKSQLKVNKMLEKVAYKEESILHLKQESEQLQASLEKKKLETEDLTEQQRSMESIIAELRFEKGTLLQDITKLSTEGEVMLAHMEDMCERIGELSGGDLLLMKTIGDMLNTSIDGDDWSTDLVDFDKLHVSDVNSANGTFSVTAKKHEANFDGRAPLREVNNLHL